jgi:hypothetical protein
MRTTTDTTNIPHRESTTTDRTGGKESPLSAVSWPAIFGGAITAVALSLILLILGTGLGLSSVSPWSFSGVSATTLTVMAVVWLIVMQAISSGVGGYLTGRLRTKWVGVHDDEVFFRDSAHGFLSWVVATVFTVAFLASAATSMVSGGVRAATSIASAAASGAGQAAVENMNDPTAYLVDSLFRSAQSNSDQDIRGETTRILMNSVARGEFSSADRAYLAQLVAARTGLTPTEASSRVDEIIAQVTTAKEKAKQEIDMARQAAARFSLFAFLSMLVGAFIASVAATIGGKHRDAY